MTFFGLWSLLSLTWDGFHHLINQYQSVSVFVLCFGSEFDMRYGTFLFSHFSTSVNSVSVSVRLLIMVRCVCLSGLAVCLSMCTVHICAYEMCMMIREWPWTWYQSIWVNHLPYPCLPHTTYCHINLNLQNELATVLVCMYVCLLTWVLVCTNGLDNSTGIMPMSSVREKNYHPGTSRSLIFHGQSSDLWENVTLL